MPFDPWTIYFWSLCISMFGYVLVFLLDDILDGHNKALGIVLVLFSIPALLTAGSASYIVFVMNKGLGTPLGDVFLIITLLVFLVKGVTYLIYAGRLFRLE